MGVWCLRAQGQFGGWQPPTCWVESGRRDAASFARAACVQVLEHVLLAVRPHSIVGPKELCFCGSCSEPSWSLAAQRRRLDDPERQYFPQRPIVSWHYALTYVQVNKSGPKHYLLSGEHLLRRRPNPELQRDTEHGPCAPSGIRQRSAPCQAPSRAAFETFRATTGHPQPKAGLQGPGPRRDCRLWARRRALRCLRCTSSSYLCTLNAVVFAPGRLSSWSPISGLATLCQSLPRAGDARAPSDRPQ